MVESYENNQSSKNTSEDERAFEIQNFSSGESDGEEAKDDADLLTMQKQRSIPLSIQVAELNEGEEDEKVLLECEGAKLNEVENSPLLIGMMSAGAERQMFKKYSAESPALAPPTKLGGGKRNHSPGSPTEQQASK